MTQDTNREQEIFKEIISSGDVYNKGLASYLCKLEQIIDANNYKFAGISQRISKLEERPVISTSNQHIGGVMDVSAKSEPKEEECLMCKAGYTHIGCALLGQKGILRDVCSTSSPDKKEIDVKALLYEYVDLATSPKKFENNPMRMSQIIETLTNAIKK